MIRYLSERLFSMTLLQGEAHIGGCGRHRAPTRDHAQGVSRHECTAAQFQPHLILAATARGRAVQVDCIKTRVDSAYGLSA
jgi:hypothetical protein